MLPHTPDPRPIIEPVDRRRSARSPLFMLVTARDMREPMWAWEIGLGGMLCRSRAPRWPGTYLDMTFRLPDSFDELKVGGQVLSMDQIEDGVALGVRFCLTSVKVQRAIYRFLDRRRALWGEQAELCEPMLDAKLELEPVREPSPEPAQQFEGLLREAYASMHVKELQHLAFVRSLPTGGLPRLSSLVRAA